MGRLRDDRSSFITWRRCLLVGRWTVMTETSADRSDDAGRAEVGEFAEDDIDLDLDFDLEIVEGAPVDLTEVRCA